MNGGVVIRVSDAAGMIRGLPLDTVPLTETAVGELMEEVRQATNAHIEDSLAVNVVSVENAAASGGDWPSASQVLRLVFAGGSEADVEFPLPAPADACFDEDGEPILESGPLSTLVPLLKSVLLTEGGNAVGDLKSATLGAGGADEALIEAAARLPGGQVGTSGWWKAHGGDVVVNQEP